ncbi:MAG TPA: lipid biosynthesis B12-binding/radical SAM protein [Methylomusa anaerophila]|uniref:(Dimethylallyl)adenosine tRNA methylthiotransferase MiaB n=1 Tax=Methylomusa anaerophila TaxID=1930071 RepID=A0A348AK59_9FIRM|nr:lipid biosynthesis B12-binding/radical SAM protein [Methylomusa anaerophila]BBB91457.1 (Dimethylallyl)adenosine tRNA methylthiotransferase MiaB [Methylomusa anaerophila]HML89953.1 lipid biosynthesis B12-binding/radical SAM protein [Methylomusa anaerophila]
MKVLMISFNQECFPEPVFPIGAYYVAKSIVEDHEVEYIDRNLFSDEDVIKRIKEFQPDAVSIAFRNLDNTQYPLNKAFAPSLKSFISHIRANYTGPIVLGGSGFSIMPQEMLAYTGADYGIVGAGEVSFLSLLNQLNQLEKKELLMSPLIIGNQISLKFNKAHSEKLQKLNEQFNFNWYYDEGGAIGITTKRGCPHRCIYCSYPLIEGTEYQLREPADVVNEIEYYLETMGIRHFFFTDSVFNDPSSHSVSIAAEIIKRKIPIEWTAYFSPANLNRDDLLLYKDSGCTGIDLGVESGSDSVLKHYGKNYNVEKILEVVKDCGSVNMPLLPNMLLGGPGETEETLSDTFEILQKINPKAVFMQVGIRIYPKTPIYYTALQEGIINDKTDLLTPHFYIAPAVKDFIIKKVEDEGTKHPNWFVPGLGVNIGEGEQAESPRKQFGVKGSLWIHLPSA